MNSKTGYGITRYEAAKNFKRKHAIGLLLMIEKAYRRGFHQGVYISANENVDLAVVSKWRYSELNKCIPASINKKSIKKEYLGTILDRLNMESKGEEERELYYFIENFFK